MLHEQGRVNADSCIFANIEITISTFSQRPLNSCFKSKEAHVKKKMLWPDCTQENRSAELMNKETTNKEKYLFKVPVEEVV